MQFERIKKSHKKEIIIGGVVVLGIVSALTLVTTRAKYKVTENIKLVDGTINYKPYDFKVMAMYQSEDGINYTEIEKMPSSGYVINEDKTYCTTDNQTQVKGKIKTVDGNHTISNLSKSDKCYLYFDKKKPTASEAILDNITLKTTTPDFSVAATTDEGVYEVEDEMYGGSSYYWRGAVTNNYVKFADFCWRIIRINGDGSIRLIYDGAICHANGTSTTESIAVASTAYSISSNQSYYVGWTYNSSQRPSTANPQTSGTASNAKAKVEQWYSSNIIESNAMKVTDGKYCNDRNVASGYAWASAPSSTFYYAGFMRLHTNYQPTDYQPTLSCSNGDIYSLKVGLITADEVEFAGGKDKDNKQYYLYNGQDYWTMSPSYWSSGNAGVFFVQNGGFLNAYYVSKNTYGIRPVINLKSDVTFSDGDGTLDNPYIVS